MAFTEEQLKAAARKAVAAGDTAAAARLIAAARAAGQAQPIAAAAETMPQAAPEAAPVASGAIPPMNMPANPELALQGPGPGGGMQQLFDQGILPRRYQEGRPPEPPKGTVFDQRTGMNLPETVQDGTGATLYLNPETSTYSSQQMMTEGMKPGAGKAFQAGAAQGFTLGFGDEIAGAVLGETAKVRSRAMIDAAKRDRPGMTMAGEISGVLANPLLRGKSGGPLKTAIVEGAKTGAKAGAAYAVGTAEGGIIDRVPEGLEGAATGAIFGALAPVAVNIGTKAFRRVFKASAERPTLESLKSAKSLAYRAVDEAGEKFDATETTRLLDTVKSALDDVNYVPGVDTQTDAALRLLERNAGKELSLGQLDKLRQNLFTRFNTAKNEVGLLDAIDAIDELVTSRTATSELLDAARLANARYKKAEVLDLAFKKATDQTAATGSGGNILNKYRQAVTAIINNPKQSRWFSADEVDTMRQFVRGSTGQNTMRLIGKLAPSGNGLMTALNLGAVSFGGPGMLAVSAGASGAKAIADRGTERAAQGLIAKVSGATPRAPQPIQYGNKLNALAGINAPDVRGLFAP